MAGQGGGVYCRVYLLRALAPMHKREYQFERTHPLDASLELPSLLQAKKEGEKNFT